MLRCISHFKRLNQSPCKYDVLPDIPTVRNVRANSVNDKTRSIITKVIKRTIDRVDEMRPFRVSDLALSNLIALGVKMTPTNMSASPHKSVSDMVATLAHIPVDTSDNV